MLTETAVFGGGCFWCTEAIYQNLRGVVSVVPGYTGGTEKNPTYEQVCAGATGHVEAVKIEFDPSQITYRDLLEVFFSTHNPTTPNQQGNDIGTQYRSSIFYTSSEQATEVRRIIQELTEAKFFEHPIITTYEPLREFFEAEDYHHNYYTRNPQAGYCQAIIAPKLKKFREKYVKLLK